MYSPMGTTGQIPSHFKQAQLNVNRPVSIYPSRKYIAQAFLSASQKRLTIGSTANLSTNPGFGILGLTMHTE